MPSGGARQGQPGGLYPNRSDLRQPKAQPIRTATNQPYGQATQQANAQRAMPLPTGTPVPSGPLPGAAGAFDRPTERPNEPLTHGLPTGPGGGPEVMDGMAGPDPTVAQLRALYTKFPNEDLRELLEDIDTGKSVL